MPSSIPRPGFGAFPAIRTACLFGIGIFVDSRFDISFPIWIYLITSAFFIAIWTFRAEKKSIVTLLPLLRNSLILFVVFLSGAIRNHSQHDLPRNHLLFTAPLNAQITLSGTLYEWSERSYGFRFVLETDSLFLDDFLPTFGSIQVFMRLDSLQRNNVVVRNGDRIEVTGKLSFPSAIRNPGEFDYQTFLSSKGIYHLLSLNRAEQVEKLASSNHSFTENLTLFQSFLRRAIVAHVPDKRIQPILFALILGDRTLIDESVLVHFSRTGLMHVLAVSGLHVLLVGMILFRLLGPGINRLRLMGIPLDWTSSQLVRVSITLLVLASYMVVTGMGASVVRAVVMASLFMLAPLLNRFSSSLNTLGVAAFILLFLSPSTLFNAGFQLSFTAVASLLTIPSLFSGFLSALPGWLRSIANGMVSSFAATVGTLPVLLFHFGSVSFAGLLLNTLAIPLTFLTLTSGLMTCLWHGFQPVFADAFGYSSSLFGLLLVYTARFGDGLFDWLRVSFFLKSGWMIAVLALLPFALANWKRVVWRNRLVACILVSGILHNWVPILSGNSTSLLEVVFIDVGQGDAIFIRFPNDLKLLIDAGPRTPYSDSGAKTVLPFLRQNNVRSLDGVLFTHPDSDHLGGIPSLLRHMDSKNIFYNGLSHDTFLFRETLLLADSLGIVPTVLSCGDDLSLDGSVSLKVLHPCRQYPPATDSPNAASIVLRLEFGNHVFLFMGDAEAEAESFLSNHFPRLLDADLVKVGHHGSSTSSLPFFIEETRKENATNSLAIVSVGERNRYGHPDPEVIADWQHRGSKVLTTAEDGAVWIQSDGVTVSQLAWRR